MQTKIAYANCFFILGRNSILERKMKKAFTANTNDILDRKYYAVV